MSLSIQEVESVANLARLHLSPEELASMSIQLGKILNYFKQLDEVDISNVEPLAHPLPVHNVFRADQVATSLDVATALANAPKRQGDFFSVPAVFE